MGYLFIGAIILGAVIGLIQSIYKAHKGTLGPMSKSDKALLGFLVGGAAALVTPPRKKRKRY
ncbi:MAG: hypothetical protein LBN22_01740 [Clostridiales Family XIII bacterium]|jgi:fructose-specific phosphotransferase system IIC component|nr:hypothetical protein [Clostridiales Family XIII bacterium]